MVGRFAFRVFEQTQDRLSRLLSIKSPTTGWASRAGNAWRVCGIAILYLAAGLARQQLIGALNLSGRFRAEYGIALFVQFGSIRSNRSCWGQIISLAIFAFL